MTPPVAAAAAAADEDDEEAVEAEVVLGSVEVPATFPPLRLVFVFVEEEVDVVDVGGWGSCCFLGGVGT